MAHSMRAKWNTANAQKANEPFSADKIFPKEEPVDSVDKKDEEILALKAALKYVEFSSAGGCCHFCGGRLRHDGNCGIGALLREESAERFKEVTGGTVIRYWMWSVNNEEKYASIKAAVK